MQHLPRYSHNATFLSFIHPILLWVVGCFQLSLNASLQNNIKFIRHILTSIISLEILHFIFDFFLNQCLELYEIGECLIFILHEEYPTLL